jgi:hypothetical protein
MIKWNFKTMAVVGSILVVLILGISFLSNWTKRTSEAFREAKAFIEVNQQIKTDIGDIKGYGIKIEGNYNSPKGSSDFTFDVSGSKKTARINVKLDKSELGRWTVSHWKYVSFK